PTPYLEVPTVIVAPGLNGGPVCAQGHFEGPQPLLVRPPPFGPDPERARPGKREPTHTAPPPEREAAGQSTAQAGQGLAQMEECRPATQPEHPQSLGSGRARERSPGRAQAGLEASNGACAGRHRP